MEVVVIGGNIRCFTKLAGRRYWLDVKGKILFLESYGGGTGQIATLFTQLEQIEVFEQVTGVLLGIFTEYDEEKLTSSAYELLKMHISETLPVACTGDIVHRSDSKAITIGKIIKLQND